MHFIRFAEPRRNNPRVVPLQQKSRVRERGDRCVNLQKKTHTPALHFPSRPSGTLFSWSFIIPDLSYFLSLKVLEGSRHPEGPSPVPPAAWTQRVLNHLAPCTPHSWSQANPNQAVAPPPIPMPEPCAIRALGSISVLVGARDRLPQPLHYSIAAPAAPCAESSALRRHPRSSAQPRSRSLHKPGTQSSELTFSQIGIQTPWETVKAEPLLDCSPQPHPGHPRNCQKVIPWGGEKPEREMPPDWIENISPWTANSSSKKKKKKQKH